MKYIKILFNMKHRTGQKCFEQLLRTSNTVQKLIGYEMSENNNGEMGNLDSNYNDKILRFLDVRR